MQVIEAQIKVLVSIYRLEITLLKDNEVKI